MRVLKSLVLFFFIIASAQAQDTAAGKKADSLFHAEKKTGVTWGDQKVPDSTLQQLRDDDAFWYANADLKKRVAQTKGTTFWQWLFGQRWFFNLLWTIIIGSFVAVLFLFLLKSNIPLFRKGATAIDATAAPALMENIFSIDYDKQLQAAVAAGDYSAAVRLQYLHLLTLLSNKNLIQYKEEYTNSDYLQQLLQTPYCDGFKKLTHQFEYAWYGRFVLTPAMYKIIEQDFNTFKNSMGV